MPRPIAKEDLKELKSFYEDKRFKFMTYPDLGIVVLDKYKEDRIPWAYQCYKRKFDGMLVLNWISDRTFKLRKKLGHPKPRKKHIKQIMREPDFPLDEIALAQEIMEGLK